MVAWTPVAAGAGAAAALTIARPVTAMIPGGGIGRAILGAVLAWVGMMFDGVMGAFAVGFGVGLVAEGLLGLVLVGESDVEA